MPQRVCTTCKFCLRDDYGYSNYTVEGTTLQCLLELNPELDGQEEHYDMTSELARILDFAQTCSRYSEGHPATLDVDREDVDNSKTVTAEDIVNANYTDDLEIAELIRKQFFPLS